MPGPAVRRRVALALLIAAAALMPGVSAALAAATPPPRTHQPKPAGGKGPPPAWIASTTESAWLAYGSFCWRGRCVQYLAPALRPQISVFRVRRGAAVSIHFGFTPKTVSVGLIEEGAPPRTLAPARVALWRPAASGRFEVQAASENGTVSYIGSILISG